MTEQNENRLDRVERILEQITERQDRTDQQIAALAERQERTDRQIAALAERQERTDRKIEHLAEITDRLIARNAEQIAALSQEIGFLRAAVLGHISQSTPPAHKG